MCTVLFIPGADKYYFASLRDESPLRAAALAPETRVINGVEVLSPMDAKAGGTWIGITAYGSIIILLNGAFQNHHRRQQYKKSRGLIVRELLSSAFPVKEWEKMDMEEIEPFTLVVWMENNLYQLVWDGIKKEQLKLRTDQPYIWSSSTLYQQQAKIYRKQLFQNWINSKPAISMMSVFQFFSAYTDNNNGFLMNRNEKVKTLSYSFIELHPGESASMAYHDFSNGISDQNKLNFHVIEDAVAANPAHYI